MYYIYWIKYKNHTDPYSEGYIGISNNIKSRFRYHSNKNCSDNPILLSAIQKGAEITLLETVQTKEEALNKEIVYRPSPRIGWNIISGGVSPPNQKGRSFIGGMKNKKHTKETKKLMSQQRLGMKWWTNGNKNTKTFECPEGFTLGRTIKYDYNLSDKGREKIGKAGKAITTPFGNFDTIRNASKNLKMTEDQIAYRVKSKKYNEWNYLRK